VAADHAATAAAIADRYAAALRAGGTLFFAGNGGSAADAQHIATEYVVRFRANRPPLRAVALTTDTSLLTACANDMGFDAVFARQVEAHGRPGTAGAAPTSVTAPTWGASRRAPGVTGSVPRQDGHEAWRTWLVVPRTTAASRSTWCSARDLQWSRRSCGGRGIADCLIADETIAACDCGLRIGNPAVVPPGLVWHAIRNPQSTIRNGVAG
jgi:hypothetical protein